jgi:hypothetical protein
MSQLQELMLGSVKSLMNRANNAINADVQMRRFAQTHTGARHA